MSFVGFGAGPSTGLRFATTRGRIQGTAVQGMSYPSPFFDIAHTYLPVTVKQLFRWCRYYFLTNPLVNAVSFKLSEYPVTDLIIDHNDPGVVKRWEEYYQDHLRIRAFLVEVGLDRNVYGNAMLSIGYPFKKYLFCPSCDFRDEASKIRAFWIFTNHNFRLTCPRCHQIGDAKVEDFYYKNASGIKIIRWNPEDVEITYNDITGEYVYFYNIPPVVRNDVVIGRKDIVESIPQVFIQAMREQKGVVFSKDNFFHMRRPTIATQDRGWGIPLLLPVLKDLFYLQIMKKANECVAPATLLETSEGLLPAAEVQVGTVVRTRLGGFSTVTQKTVRPMLEERGDYAVTVTLTSMRQMSSTFSSNHPLWVLRRNDINRRKDSKEHRCSTYVLRNPDLYEFKWVEAGGLCVGDYVGYPTARTREDQVIDIAAYADLVATDMFVYSGVSKETAEAFEKLEEGLYVSHDNPGRVAKKHKCLGTTPKRLSRYLELDEDLAYIAGWYLGDGSIGTRRVDFSMGPDDDGLELQAAIERVFGSDCARYPCQNSRGWMLVACETIFSEFIGKWISGHSKTKRIPKEVLAAPDDIVLAFLRGYLEADGCTALSIKHNEQITVCCANKQLTYQLWSLLLSFGCISTVSERVSYDAEVRRKDGSVLSIAGGRPQFFWSVRSRSARRLGQLLAGDLAESVTSGKSGFFIHGYFATRVNSVEVVDCPEVISFEVSDDHTFCVPGMATHNSIFLEHIIPLRAIFPQAGSGSADPYLSVNLQNWRDQIAQEIARWRYDCVSADTLVDSESGVVPAEEIEAGYRLKNHVGGYSRVKKVWRRPLREGERAYKISARGLHGATPTVSEGHPFLVRRKKNNGNGHQLCAESSFVRAKDIHPGDYLGCPLPAVRDHGLTQLDLADFVSNAATEKWIYVDHQSPEVPEAFEYLEQNGPAVDRKALLEERGWSVNPYKIAQIAHREGRTLRRLPRFLPFDEELCWVLGLYLAEGSTSPKQVLFALHVNETVFQERLDRFFSERFGASGLTAERSEYGIQRYYSSTLAAQFFHEMCGGTSVTKRLHVLLKQAGDRRLAHLVRGYFDGDGCYHENDGSGKYDAASASRQLAADIRDVFLSVGILPGLTHVPPAPYVICGKKGISHGHYRITTYGDGTKRLKAWLTGDVLPSALYRIGVLADGYVWHRVEEVAEVELEEVIGFQMDEEVVVHLEDDTEAHGTFCLWGSACANTNYIPILPLPIGQQIIGGDGRALLLTSEIQAWSEQIITGMGVPFELLRGGLSFSGSNVSLRMLENSFIGYLIGQLQFVRWTMRQIGSFLDWPIANARFKPFKMADDLQRRAFDLQLNSAGKLSDTSLLSGSDYSSQDENALILSETDQRFEATKKQQLAMAEIQGQSQLIMMKYQVKGQQVATQAQATGPAPGEPGDAGGATPMMAPPPEQQAAGQVAAAGGAPAGPPSPPDFLQSVGSQLSGSARMAANDESGANLNVDLPSFAMAQAHQIVLLPKPQQELALRNLELQSPELATLVRQMLGSLQANGGGSANGKGGPGGSTLDARPLPDQRAPRRAGGSI